MRGWQVIWLWRIGVWGLGVVPLAFAVHWIVTSRLGPNPVEFLEHYTGDWALQLLLVTLVLTPLRKLTGRTEPIRVRRTIGLWAYAYLCLHFSIYLVFDLELSLPRLGDDLIHRTYVALGFTAWMMLLPLAITSTDRWQRRLKRDWKTLHRLIYPAAILGALHYLWLVKADTRKPLIYFSILLLLLAWRLPWAAVKVQRASAAPPSASNL
jgi:methionine sulfoxide reductase heme-binding subunit